jgi:hypothetical protein
VSDKVADERVYRIVSPDAQPGKTKSPRRGVIIMTVSVSELEEEIAQLRDLDLPGLRARAHDQPPSLADDQPLTIFAWPFLPEPAGGLRFCGETFKPGAKARRTDARAECHPSAG